MLDFINGNEYYSKNSMGMNILVRRFPMSFHFAPIHFLSQSCVNPTPKVKNGTKRLSPNITRPYQDFAGRSCKLFAHQPQRGKYGLPQRKNVAHSRPPAATQNRTGYGNPAAGPGLTFYKLCPDHQSLYPTRTGTSV